MVVKKDGRAIKFDSTELPKQRRGGQGIKVTQVEQGDEVVAAFSVVE